MTFLRRYGVYLGERFSPWQYGLLAGLVALTIRVGLEAPLNVEPRDWMWSVGVALGLALFLYRLRVFDEHKDAEHDRRFYPQRPVARGLVTLQELDRTLWLTVAAEMALAGFGGWAAMAWFGVAFSYSLVMRQEFFVRSWIRRHFTLYVGLHEILLIPLLWYLLTLSGTPSVRLTSASAWWLVGFLGLQIFLLEVARKVRAPADENASRDTYSAQYGVAGATTLVVLLGVATVILGVVASKHSAMNSLGLLAFLPLGAAAMAYHHQASARSAKGVWLASIALMVIVDAVFIGVNR